MSLLFPASHHHPEGHPVVRAPAHCGVHVQGRGQRLTRGHSQHPPGSGGPPGTKYVPGLRILRTWKTLTESGSYAKLYKQVPDLQKMEPFQIFRQFFRCFR